MKKNWLWMVLIVAVALAASCGSCMVASLLISGSPDRMPRLVQGQRNAVAVVEVKGVIVSGRRADAFPDQSLAYSESVIQDIKRAIEDPVVQAVVLEVDSPGGSVVPSADIYQALKECTKPIVTSMGEVAASGGYYIACATQYILARPATVTGSIGVISQALNAEELLRKLGIEVQVVRSGKYKDQGGWHRPMSEEEKAMLQAIIDEAHEEFVRVIAEGRDMPVDQVRGLANGRICTGRQAVSLGLVDAEGDFEDAVQIAARLGGIDGEPRIVRFERRPTFFESLWRPFGGSGRSIESMILRELVGGDAPRPQYLYTGP